jgi:hypothetical protein
VHSARRHLLRPAVQAHTKRVSVCVQTRAPAPRSGTARRRA